MCCIGIVGGGFSGLMTAYHILTLSENPVQVKLFNVHRPLGKGTAFSTNEELHLLNVAAANMSALPESPDHFSEWILKHYPEYTGRDLTKEFVPRKLYGEYLQDFVKALSKDKNFISIGKEVQDIEALNDSLLVRTADEDHNVDAVILATGNLLPAKLIEKDSPYFINDPWDFNEIRKKASTAERLLILGTGLSMIDIVLQLDHDGFEKEILCVSSNGLLPKQHKFGNKYPDYLNELNECKDLNSVFSCIKKHLQNAQNQGYSRESVIDVLRPFSQEIWTRFNQEDQQRFLRHLKHSWNVLRHRIPASSAQVIEKKKLEGLLQINAGKLVKAEDSGKGLKVELKLKRSKSPVVVDNCLVINCTGPLADYRKTNSPLFRNLFSKGLATFGNSGLGLNAMHTGELLTATGDVIKDMYTLGPPLKSVLWETTAVNEIRKQAKKLAKTVCIRKGLIA